MSLNSVVIYGSARRDRQGIKAARFVMNGLEERGHDVKLIDTQEYDLPFLDLMHKEYDAGDVPAAMSEISGLLSSADGFVVVSAEYNHSVSAALKNLLDHFQSEYLYKPSAIVTYSAGPFGGVRALVNLRAILAELGASSIPSAFPVSQIHNAFDEDGRALDPAYEQRVVKFLDEYEWYARALRAARRTQACCDEPPIQQELCRNAGDSA